MSEKQRPRIAIVGNMNNAGFTIMRYFRDLGADAWLLPYATDGTGNLSHFAPEADTWQWEKWRPFVRPLDIPNSSEALIGRPWRLSPPPSRRSVAAQFDGYDAFVGSGVAPALLGRIGKRLDIFFPYGIGIEFYGDHLYLARLASSPLRKLLLGRVRRLQAEGIRQARRCLNAEMSLTRQSFEELGKPFEKIGIPAVYNKDDGAVTVPDWLKPILRRIDESDLSLFCAARLLWVRDPAISEADWPHYTKNSDWLLHGLAEFLRRHPKANPLLCLVEYGQDVGATKELVESLGLGAFVQWLPTMARREIMLCLDRSDIGVGEFYTDPGLLWGGTGWEALAAGRPLLQAFNFTHDEYSAQFGHQPPPILDAKSAQQIADHLAAIYAAPDKGRVMGAEAARWFDQHGGIGLAKRWLAMLDGGIEAHGDA